MFRDSYVLCIYIYEHFMSILHIAVSGYGTQIITYNIQSYIYNKVNLNLKIQAAIICVAI